MIELQPQQRLKDLVGTSVFHGPGGTWGHGRGYITGLNQTGEGFYERTRYPVVVAWENGYSDVYALSDLTLDGRLP